MGVKRHVVAIAASPAAVEVRLEVASEEADPLKPAGGVPGPAADVARVRSGKRHSDHLALQDSTHLLPASRIAQATQGATQRTPVGGRAAQLNGLQLPVRGLRQQSIATAEQGRQGPRQVVTGPARQRSDLDRRPVDGDRHSLGRRRRRPSRQPAGHPVGPHSENGGDQRPAQSNKPGDPKNPLAGRKVPYQPSHMPRR